MFVVLARYRTSVENAARVAELLPGLAAASRAEPGNRGYAVLVGLDDPCEFAIVEHYVDRAAFDAHVASTHFNEIAVERIRPLLMDRQVGFWGAVPGSE